MLALLRRAREDAGLTQRDLAARLRCHHSWVAKVEIGERRLDVIELIRVLRALETDPLRFVSRLLKSAKL